MLRRIFDFALVWVAAAAVWVVAGWLWPYLELVSAVGALVVLMLAVNVADGAWFAIRQSRRVGAARQARVPAPIAGPPARQAQPAVSGTR